MILHQFESVPYILFQDLIGEHSETRKLPVPTLSQSHVLRGRLICQICFEGCEKRYLKLKAYAEKWESKNHEYNPMNKHVAWISLDEIWAHKQCKGKFLKDDYLSKQASLPANEESTNNIIDEGIGNSSSNDCDNTEIRQRTRKRYTYHSSWKDEEKNGGPIPLPIISVTDTAKKTLKEFSELHIKNNNQKYLDGAHRILITLATKSLLAADVAYHKQSCYEPF